MTDGLRATHRLDVSRIEYRSGNSPIAARARTSYHRDAGHPATPARCERHGRHGSLGVSPLRRSPSSRHGPAGHTRTRRSRTRPMPRVRRAVESLRTAPFLPVRGSRKSSFRFGPHRPGSAGHRSRHAGTIVSEVSAAPEDHRRAVRPPRGSTSRSWWFEDSIETGGMES